ncbi:integrase core domain-containing protein [Pseudomonas sp. LAIL14HWK12:I12]|uniref:integrase core domain-containing protein n=2 Tax=Pseudomonas TaxID=286 RepID=UPI00117A179B
MPVAICTPNSRSISLRSEGAPGERIAPRPVNFCIHPAGRPINTSIKVLRRPVESAQYASSKFRFALAKKGFAQSMSRRGNCWDNAVAESFFATLKREEACTVYPTKKQAHLAIASYFHGFYNSSRLHSALGYRSPKRIRKRRKAVGSVTSFLASAATGQAQRYPGATPHAAETSGPFSTAASRKSSGAPRI